MAEAHAPGRRATAQPTVRGGSRQAARKGGEEDGGDADVSGWWMAVCVVVSGWYASTWSPEVGFVVSGGLVGSNERQADLFVLKPKA